MRIIIIGGGASGVLSAIYAKNDENEVIILETKNLNGKYRRLIIGDDTLHRVSLKLWSEKIEPNRLYLKGDIICAKDVRYKQWNNIYELESTFLTKIGFYGDTKQGKALKKFYHSHKKIEEYKELNK